MADGVTREELDQVLSAYEIISEAPEEHRETLRQDLRDRMARQRGDVPQWVPRPDTDGQGMT